MAPRETGIAEQRPGGLQNGLTLLRTGVRINLPNRNGERSRQMKRELGIGKCGLACCLCSENASCAGCDSGSCPDSGRCENRACCAERGISHCYACEQDCRKGLLRKIKPYGFTLFVKRCGVEALLDCLAENEKRGAVYHREGLHGDYDGFDDVEALIRFIQDGSR